MISCFLFGFAIPLAVFASPILRLAVWLYTAIFGVAPTTASAQTVATEVAVPAGGGSDQVTRLPDRHAYTTEAREGTTTGGEPESMPPVSIPSFKMGFATLAVFLFAAAAVAGFGRLLLLAVAMILRSKGMLGLGQASTVYLAFETLLALASFVLLVLLLRELLPANFQTASIVAGLFVSLAIVFALVLIGVLWLWFAFVSWLAEVLRWASFLTASLACPVGGFVEILLDFSR